jgi:hypothetical protein
VNVRVEVGDNSALALGDRDVLVASALDDGERNVRHWIDGKYASLEFLSD